ncbi:MFS general substrate transporter [Alternaria alternata]|nr:MFS general substrate transporter [Alternaria alternata]
MGALCSHHIPGKLCLLQQSYDAGVFIPADCRLQCWQLCWKIGTRPSSRQARSIQLYDWSPCSLRSDIVSLLASSCDARACSRRHARHSQHGLDDQSPILGRGHLDHRLLHCRVIPFHVESRPARRLEATEVLEQRSGFSSISTFVHIQVARRSSAKCASYRDQDTPTRRPRDDRITKVEAERDSGMNVWRILSLCCTVSSRAMPPGDRLSSADPSSFLTLLVASMLVEPFVVVLSRTKHVSVLRTSRPKIQRFRRNELRCTHPSSQECGISRWFCCLVERANTM